ncbi:MAG: rhomboid family intramembrane serine protease [Alphaproteobacteria bacterium]|nr:rhomboid family intramembrane serine protease [Alphaproteobacteria bacterium]
MGQGAWALHTGRAPDAWVAWFGRRPDTLRGELGGQVEILVDGGDLWRLLSSGLVHADLFHLLTNGLVLLALGWLLEPRLGAARWLAVVCLGVLGGSVVAWLSGVARSDGVSAGAFALLGAAVAVGRRWPELDDGERRGLVQGLGSLAGLNLALSMAVPSLDAAAHAGGFLTGLVTGAALRQGPGSRLWWGLVAGCGAVAGAGAIGLLGG